MMTLAVAARVLGASLRGTDATFLAVSTDTRKIVAGDLFVALQGPNFDGHEFVVAAARSGAAGAIVSCQVDTGLPLIVVEDTRLALGRLAAHWRSSFNIPVVAVTGSNGKTTVKNMIAAILGEMGPGLVTQGNLNNDIGLPLTLLKLRAGDRHAVIEMGMNHAGEIDYLTRLTRPGVALITNAGEAHLAGLGSIENVARAKGEIFAGLAADGTAVINADDRFAALWRGLATPRRCVTFGMQKRADVQARYVLGDAGSQVTLATPEGETVFELRLLGRHNVLNAAGAAAAALAAGAALDHVRQGLAKLRPAPGRLELKPGRNGARVLDDTYNANPASLQAAIGVLCEARGERVLALGDMGELGPSAPAIHARMGEFAKQQGVKHLLAVGELTKAAVHAFGAGAQHFVSHEALGAALTQQLHGDMTVLVKGSRSSRMERVVAAITTAGETP
jgi:UDP-N-acetylmuramoyl-tripeptide--D-alanyl-D-alanine ligase